MFKFTKDYLDSLHSIEDYNIFFEKIVAKELDEAPYNEEGFYNYTAANLKRSKSLKRKIDINKKLYNILDSISDWTFVLITEPWCGDASFSQPVVEALALAGNLNLKIALRDKNEALMDAYLTNGGKSIPILVALDGDLNPVFSWGPRPTELQKIIKALVETKPSLEEKIKVSHQWYIKDKGQTIQVELLDLIKKHTK